MGTNILEQLAPPSSVYSEKYLDFAEQWRWEEPPKSLYIHSNIHGVIR
jgi:hypothetical protein